MGGGRVKKALTYHHALTIVWYDGTVYLSKHTKYL